MRSKNCIAVTLLLALLFSCMGRMVGGGSGAPGGEVTGVSTTAWNEPAPYGMVLIKRGSLKMGPEEQDSLWGAPVPTKEISVESFWMDETEVSVAKYKHQNHRCSFHLSQVCIKRSSNHLISPLFSQTISKTEPLQKQTR